MTDLKAKLTAWYNRKIVAGWYQSASVVGGWLLTIAINVPDLIAVAATHWDVIAAVALPKMSPEMKALVFALYLGFGAPALRALKQKGMTWKALVQAVQAGMVTSAPNTDAVTVQVPGEKPVVVSTLAAPVDVLEALRPGSTPPTFAPYSDADHADLMRDIRNQP